MSKRLPWRRWLRQARAATLEHWPIKVTALVLATVLWAAVAAEEPTTQLAPVSLVVEPPPGRTLTQELPPMQALFAGPARELIKLYSSPPRIHRVLPDTLTGSQYHLELVPRDVDVPSGVQVTVQDIQPRVVTILLDDVAQKTVSVSHRVTIEPDSGYALSNGVRVTPGSVVLRGPQEPLRRIANVRTVRMSMTGVRTPVQRTVPIDTAGLGVVRVLPESVEIAADIVAVSERVIMGVPVTIRSERGTWVASPPAIIVTVRGTSGRLARLTRDSVLVIAAPAGDGAPEMVRLDVVPPAGLSVELTPDSVTVQERPDG